MDWSSKTMGVLERIMFLSVLNVLWLMGVAAGLGIFGLFPATFAPLAEPPAAPDRPGTAG